MSFIGCAGSEEEGANFEPPLIGTPFRKLRESRKDPNVVVHEAAKDFHKRRATKAGIDTVEGQAHFKLMNRHMKKIQASTTPSNQKRGPMGQVLPRESSEGGPGSGPHKGGAYDSDQRAGTPNETVRDVRHKLFQVDNQKEPASSYHKAARKGESVEDMRHRLYKVNDQDSPISGHPELKEAGGKVNPVSGIPEKSKQPSEDIRQNKPAVPLSRLQQSQYLADRYDKSHESRSRRRR